MRNVTSELGAAEAAQAASQKQLEESSLRLKSLVQQRDAILAPVLAAEQQALEGKEVRSEFRLSTVDCLEPITFGGEERIRELHQLLAEKQRVQKDLQKRACHGESHAKRATAKLYECCVLRRRLAKELRRFHQSGMLEEDRRSILLEGQELEDRFQKMRDAVGDQLAPLSGRIQEAEAAHSAEEARNELKAAEVARLRMELMVATDSGVHVRLLRRAQLPESRTNCRAVQLATRISMDWCVVVGDSATGKEVAVGVQDFFETQEAAALKQIVDQGLIQTQLVWLSNPEGDEQPGRHVFLHPYLWRKLQGNEVKFPPTKLNFFELLRSSLGDPQFSDVWLVPAAPHFHQKALGLDRMKEVEAPLSIQKHLRPYQLVGFRWLATLARNGLGAVLADDMGLGKTLQCIAMLTYLKEQDLLYDERGSPRPALVVVPPGLLRNWQNEFKKWAPELSFFVYHGLGRQLPPCRGSGYDVVLTTYEMVRNDQCKLADPFQISFSAMVIDEAQKIKNHGAQVSKAVKRIGNVIGHTRIALSGTPIENKVDELHSIFDFVNFGYLGSHDSFRRTFSMVIEKGRDPARKTESLELLQRLTRPFQMRRLKTDPNILPDLPSKIDIPETVVLTKEQVKLYQAVQEDFKTTMIESRQTSINHSFERRGHIFAMLEQARRICAHPLCLDRTKYPESCKGMTLQERAELSGKTQRLVSLLEEIFDANEKAVIFVTRIDVIELLKKLLQLKFANTEILTFSGKLSLEERAQVERRFQTDSRCQILLMTLQCGGIGLNLTAANHVIHFDRCYNPAKEAQATDRCHRLGQQKSVCVHRLITEGTYEENLEKIMQRKQDLSSLTVTRAEDWIADYDDQALFDLFMLRSGTGRQQGPDIQPSRSLEMRGKRPMPEPDVQETSQKRSK